MTSRARHSTNYVTKVVMPPQRSNDHNKKSKMSLKKTLKTLEILDKPEVIFNRRLNSNPFYPFEKVGKNSK